MHIFMSHDVDWSRSGPPIEHILARKERFDESTIRRVKEENFNPYFGIPYIEEIEKEFQVRSTFFFRPRYDDGRTVGEYVSVIKELLKGGWEIGLHINDSNSQRSVLNEKEVIENLTGSRIIGSRAHYLRISADHMKFLRSAGFLYDSSLNFEKEKFDLRNTEYIIQSDGLVVFPITFMDAYLFTYSKLGEDKVIDFILSGLSSARDSGKEFATILWHDNSVLMKGGRLYRTLIEKILQTEDMRIVRGADAYEIAKTRIAS
jgi:peptidoglycan/xylan/chitin deacetylase (PgdA/CDA1 family)